MSDEKPKWKKTKLRPYKGLVDKLQEVRDKLVEERDRLEREIQEKEQKQDDA
jgi:hypothetical protein